MKIFEFNPDSTNPLLHLAYANGFLPQTYTTALKPLFSDYHVISLHPRPMWGDCPPESLKHWSQMGDDLIAGLEELKAKNVVGIGHSMGGVITLYAALKRPDLFSKLVLIDPTMLDPKLLWKIRWMRLFGLEARNQLVQGALRRKRTWPSREEVFQYFKGKPLFKNWPEEAVRVYAESLTEPSGNGEEVRLIYPPEWEARIYRTIPTDVWSLPRRILCPALVIRGENSNTFTSESERAFRKANPKVPIVVVNGASHFVPQEKPEEVGKLIMDFLQESLNIKGF
jgi:pimeloyl-ACP methyl ester carboxylesterase